MAGCSFFVGKIRVEMWSMFEYNAIVEDGPRGENECGSPIRCKIEKLQKLQQIQFYGTG